MTQVDTMEMGCTVTSAEIWFNETFKDFLITERGIFRFEKRSEAFTRSFGRMTRDEAYDYIERIHPSFLTRVECNEPETLNYFIGGSSVSNPCRVIEKFSP